MIVIQVNKKKKIQTNSKLLQISDGKRAEECLILYRKSLKSQETVHDGTQFESQYPHVFIILGASV